MGFLVQTTSLMSRTLRINQIKGKFTQFFSSIAPGESPITIRRISDVLSFPSENDANGNFLGKIFNAAKGLLGFATGAVNFLFLSATVIFQFIVTVITGIVNFNWGITEAQLDIERSTAELTLASVWGEFFGNLTGTLITAAIGYGIAIALPVIGPTMARAILVKTLEERGQELLQDFIFALRMSTQIIARQIIIKSYVRIRDWLKSQFPNSEWVQSWGKNRWTISQGFQNFTESIDGAALQEFTGSFAEGAWEGFIETGYIMAYNIDDQISQSIRNSEIILGENIQTTIEYDRESEEEIRLPNQPSKLQQQLVLTNISQYRQIRNRDIGQFTGERLRDNISKVKPPLTLKLQWAYYQTPPFYRDGRTYLPYCEIPGAKRSKLDWLVIKQAMGGENGYTWGRFKASARLVDDFGSKVQPVVCYGGTALEAEERLRILLTLSDYNIASFSVTEELKEGRKAEGRALHKQTARIYPAYMTLVNGQKILNEDNGYTTLTGTYINKRDRIEMWYSTAPTNFNDIINDILTIPGTDVN